MEDKVIGSVEEPTMTEKRDHYHFNARTFEQLKKKMAKDYEKVQFC
jgi:hypothetical protein